MIMQVISYLFDWLADHEPVICARCGQPMFARDNQPAMTTWGKVVNLCKSCHIAVYEPSKRKELK